MNRSFSTAALESKPEILAFVQAQWPRKVSHFIYFKNEMEWTLKKLNFATPYDLELIAEMTWLLTFATHQMIDDFCDESKHDQEIKEAA